MHHSYDHLSFHNSHFGNFYRVFENQMIVSILIPIIIMFFGRCLTVLRYRQIVYSFLRYLLENIIFACNQFVNPSRQVAIFDRTLFFLVFFLIIRNSFKRWYIFHPSEAARISDILETINKTNGNLKYVLQTLPNPHTTSWFCLVDFSLDFQDYKKAFSSSLLCIG